MPPHGKPGQHIGLEAQDDAPGKACGGGDHHDGGQVAGAEKGDAQKCHEEDQRRAEVAHQGQTPHAVGGEENGENEVPLGKQAV